MIEKISDRPIRQAKVKALKERILTGIKEELEIIKTDMSENSLEDSFFERFLKQGFALLKLSDYVEKETAFMLCEEEYPEEDLVVYRVPEKYIDIWLQEDYNFVSKFLFEVEEDDFVCYKLSDRYFAFYFMSVFELMVYDKNEQ